MVGQPIKPSQKKPANPKQADWGKGPHGIEVTHDKKVVWTFADHKTMKTISSIQLLDIPGDATKGVIVH